MMKLVTIATLVAVAALPACENKEEAASETSSKETAPLLPEATNVDVDEGSARAADKPAAAEEESAGADEPSEAEEESAPAPSEDEGTEGEDYE